MTARAVVGCDGGNSFVRDALGIGQDDYGFSEPWLVCDFRFTPPDRGCPRPRRSAIRGSRQSVISLGPGHHRFSFMLDSAGDFDAESDPARVWKRVCAYLTPDDAELIRVATYTFRSLVAHRWRDGRILLAGDAAHQMPPFLGQGMCSGIRDAQNLAFKLDLALRGTVGFTLLDTYQVEREPHVRAVTEKGIELGRGQTTRDPAAAAERDRRLLAARAAGQAQAQDPVPRTGGRPAGGAFAARAGRALAPGGGRRPAPVAAGSTRSSATGSRSWPIPRSWRGLGGTAAALEQAGVRVVPLAASAADGLVADVDKTYRRWFGEHGWSAVIVRPDFYVYGAAGPRGRLSRRRWRRTCSGLRRAAPIVSSGGRRRRSRRRTTRGRASSRSRTP